MSDGWRVRAGRRGTAALSALVLAAVGLVTLSVPAPAEAAGSTPDRPDTLAAARKAGATAIGPWVRERISSRRDQDWYKFVLAKRAYSIVTLGSLPADYTLALVRPDGREIARSAAGGTGFEQIIRTLDAGTYYVRVWSARGAFSTTAAYALRWRAFGPGVQAISLRKTPVDVELVGELLNSTPDWRYVTNLRVDFVNGAGRVLGSRDWGIDQPRMAPGEIVAFRVLLAGEGVPRGTTGYRVAATAGVTSATARPGFTVTVTGRTERRTRSGNDRLYRGYVSSNDPRGHGDVRVVIREYDTYGVLNRLTTSWWFTVPARGRTPFSVSVYPLAPVNRAVLTARSDSVAW